MSQHSELIQQTIDYYDEHAGEYVRSTSGIDMSHIYSPFLSRLKKGQRILDAGCGSGRDTKAFLDLGYEVLPIDASREMTLATKRLTGVHARQMRLQEITFEDEFDGIWACASLLHIPLDELPAAICRLVRATRSGGVIFFSFKEKSGENRHDNRLFTNFTQSTLQDFLSKHQLLRLDLIWKSCDARPGVSTRWVNVIGSKMEFEL